MIRAERPSRKPRRVLEFSAGIAMGAVLGWALALGQHQPEGFVSPPLASPDYSFGTQFIQVMQHHQRTADPHQPAGAVVFLGDSHTQGLAVEAVEAGALNYGIGGQDTRHLAEAIPHLQAVKRARLVVLLIGSNDLPAQDPDGMRERLQAIAAGVEAPLLWHGIPRNRRVPLEATQEANAMIRAVCHARPGCTYVETDLATEDFQSDGSHLSPSGYRKLIATLRRGLDAALP